MTLPLSAKLVAFRMAVGEVSLISGHVADIFENGERIVKSVKNIITTIFGDSDEKDQKKQHAQMNEAMENLSCRVTAGLEKVELRTLTRYN